MGGGGLVLPAGGLPPSFPKLNVRILITALSLFLCHGQAELLHYTATNLWQAEVGLFNRSTPAMDTNGGLYLTTWNGRLLALNPDGSRRWQFKFNFESVSSPAIGENGVIHFGSRNHRLYAVDQAGRKRWEFPTGGWVDASPAIGAEGTVYCGSWDRKFYAVAADGKKLWDFPTGGPIVSSAAIDAAGRIYFGSHDRKFYALNSDGSKRWEFTTGGAILSSPALGSAGEIFFTSVDGKFYALNPDGARRWDLQTGGVSSSSPVLGPDGTIYISVNQTHCAISPEGKLLWQRGFWHPQPGYFGETAAAVLANRAVVFTGGDGYVMTVPADNGANEWLWNYWLFGPSYSSPLVGPDGTVYVMGQAGKLERLQQSVPLAQSPWPTARGNAQRNGRATKTN